jgi:hypothetical protein
MIRCSDVIGFALNCWRELGFEAGKCMRNLVLLSRDLGTELPALVSKRSYRRTSEWTDHVGFTVYAVYNFSVATISCISTVHSKDLLIQRSPHSYPKFPLFIP